MLERTINQLKAIDHFLCDFPINASWWLYKFKHGLLGKENEFMPGYQRLSQTNFGSIDHSQDPSSDSAAKIPEPKV